MKLTSDTTTFADLARDACQEYGMLSFTDLSANASDFETPLSLAVAALAGWDMAPGMASWLAGAIEDHLYAAE